MKIIFLKNVPPYRTGQVADVSNGYALNYLFPKSLAKQATEKSLDEVRVKECINKKERAMHEERLNIIIAALQDATVEVSAPAAPSGRLYAALPPAHIAQAIHDQLHITLPENLACTLPPIKTAGDHRLELTLAGTLISFTLHV